MSGGSALLVKAFDARHWTEATLMAEVYGAAKAAGIKMLLEVKIPSAVHRSGEMRADGAAIEGNQIYALVEAKRPGRHFTAGCRQHDAYDQIERDYGVRTLWINSMEAIPNVVRELAALREKAKLH